MSASTDFSSARTDPISGTSKDPGASTLFILFDGMPASVKVLVADLTKPSITSK